MQQQIPWQKIESLQKEINQLKSLGKKSTPKKGAKFKKNPLKGILKGITFTEEEIKQARKEFYNEIFNLDHILYQKHKK